MKSVNVDLANFLLALLIAASGWFVWWLNLRQQAIKRAVKLAEKELNEERDFQHLVRNQLEISRGIAMGFNDLEEQIKDLDDEVRELKAYFIRNSK